MVKVIVDNQEFYIDGTLKENFDLIKSKVKKDWDMVFIYSGTEGAGKSTLMFQNAYYCSGSRFTLDHVCFTPEDFGKKLTRPNFLQPGDSLVLDEGFFVNARSSMSTINKWIIGILSECRQKNLFLFVACPNFFDLDKNLALWRSRGMFLIEHAEFERGYFKFYNYSSKIDLFVKGKKFYNYKCTKPSFYGRFTKFMPFDLAEYRAKKLKAFEDRGREAEEKKLTPRQQKQLKQRNLCFKKLQELGMTQQKISDYLTEKGFEIDRTTVGDAILSLEVEDSGEYNNILTK